MAAKVAERAHTGTGNTSAIVGNCTREPSRRVLDFRDTGPNSADMDGVVPSDVKISGLIDKGASFTSTARWSCLALAMSRPLALWNGTEGPGRIGKRKEAFMAVASSLSPTAALFVVLSLLSLGMYTFEEIFRLSECSPSALVEENSSKFRNRGIVRRLAIGGGWVMAASGLAIMLVLAVFFSAAGGAGIVGCNGNRSAKSSRGKRIMRAHGGRLSRLLHWTTSLATLVVGSGQGLEQVDAGENATVKLPLDNAGLQYTMNVTISNANYTLVSGAKALRVTVLAVMVVPVRT